MKPNDVSQEAWDAGIAAQDVAIERCKAERLAYPFPTCNGKAVLDECIARAITAAVAAEREAWGAEVARLKAEASLAWGTAARAKDDASRLRFPDTTGQ